MSTVTVIVATYDRPDALRTAVRSVLAQELEDWKLLVVGDGCDPRTGEVLAELDDPRIRYVDLRVRFGEQSGPNSVGLALAETEYVAFLNHDDYFLRDHLARAVRALAEPEADFYVAQSAHAETSMQESDGTLRPVFTRLGPLGRDPRDGFARRLDVFEPCSAWVVRSALARSIGPWRPCRELYRTPLQDWLLRAWRLRARFVIGEVVTVFQMLGHNRRKTSGGTYRAASPEHAFLDGLAGWPLEDVRALVERDVRAHEREWRRPRSSPFEWLYVNPLTRALYRASGRDALDLYFRLRGKRKGGILSRAALERTGLPLPAGADLEAVLRDVRSAQPPQSVT